MIFNLCLCFFILIIYIFTHLSNKDKKFNNNLFLILTFILLFVLVAFRKTTMGNDTLEYIDLFKKCSIYKLDFLKTNSYFESGYVIFNVLLSFISTKPRFFMIIMSLIFNYSVYKFIKENSENYLFSVIMYINLLFFYQSMSMMRQFFALSILLLSFNLVKQKKLIKYAISVIVASLFHSTAILGILIYPMYHIKYKKKNISLIIGSTIFIMVFFDSIFPIIAKLLNRADLYNSMIGDAKIANFISFLIFLVFYIFSLIVIPKNKKIECNFYLYSFIFSFSIYAISINMAVLSRACQYFAIFSIIALPNIINNYIKNKRLIYNFVVCFFLIMYASTIMLYRPEWNSAYNYQSCIGHWDDKYCE